MWVDAAAFDIPAVLVIPSEARNLVADVRPTGGTIATLKSGNEILVIPRKDQNDGWRVWLLGTPVIPTFAETTASAP